MRAAPVQQGQRVTTAVFRGASLARARAESAQALSVQLGLGGRAGAVTLTGPCAATRLRLRASGSGLEMAGAAGGGGGRCSAQSWSLRLAHRHAGDHHDAGEQRLSAGKPETVRLVLDKRTDGLVGENHSAAPGTIMMLASSVSVPASPRRFASFSISARMVW
jgi:hypothetical protein